MVIDSMGGSNKSDVQADASKRSVTHTLWEPSHIPNIQLNRLRTAAQLQALSQRRRPKYRRAGWDPGDKAEENRQVRIPGWSPRRLAAFRDHVTVSP